MGKFTQYLSGDCRSHFEVAKYDEKLAEQIWEEGSDEVLVRAFEKTDKDSLFWGEQTIERKTSERFPAFAGVILYFAALFITALNLSTGQKPLASTGQPFSSSVTRCAGIPATARWRFAAALSSGRHTQFSSVPG